MDGASVHTATVSSSPTPPGGSVMTLRLFFAALFQQMFGRAGLRFVCLMGELLQMYFLLSDSLPIIKATKSDSPI
jgi:hypothetical protein